MDFRTLNLLYRCSRDFSHQRIRMRDLSDTECMICTYVSSHPGCSQEDAAEALRMDKTTVGKAVCTLEAKNCVERTRDDADKRVKRLRITPEGKERIADLMSLHNDWLGEILTCLQPEEQLRFENYCERLLAAAEALAEKHENGGNSHAQ